MRTIQIDFSFKLDLNSCCMLLVEIFRIHCRMSSFAKTSALACHCPLLKNIAHMHIYVNTKSTINCFKILHMWKLVK